MTQLCCESLNTLPATVNRFDTMSNINIFNSLGTILATNTEIFPFSFYYFHESSVCTISLLRSIRDQKVNVNINQSNYV